MGTTSHKHHFGFGDPVNKKEITTHMALAVIVSFSRQRVVLVLGR
jgi:hypothetical protein